MPILDIFDGELLDSNDDLISDPVVLELEETAAEFEIETGESIRARLGVIVKSSTDGADLYQKICSNFPNCANSYGLTLSINRAIKFLVATKKLADGASIGWRRLLRPLIEDVGRSFALVQKGSEEWNSLIMIVLKHEKGKKML